MKLKFVVYLVDVFNTGRCEQETQPASKFETRWTRALPASSFVKESLSSTSSEGWSDNGFLFGDS